MRKFTTVEIFEITRCARVMAPAFTEEQCQKLLQMQGELLVSGFVEAAYGLLRLEREQGVTCSQALDRYAQLVPEKAKLETEVAGLRKMRESEESRLAEVLAAGQRARADRIREERELAAFRENAAREKERLRQGVSDAMARAEVEEKDIAEAGKVKAELKCYGVALEQAAKLLGEFSQREAALARMAQAATEHGSLLEANEALRRENESVEAKTQATREERASLAADCQRLQDTYKNLTSDVGQQEALRRFQARYDNWSGILEHLATWDRVIPMRCTWPTCFAHFLVDRMPANFRTLHVCPSCGLTTLLYDEWFYTLTQKPYASHVKVRLE